MFQHTSNRVKYILTISVFILAGMITMIFGLRMDQESLVDLRLVPAIVAVLVFPSSWAVVIICFGIGLACLGMKFDALGFLTFLKHNPDRASRCSSAAVAEVGQLAFFLEELHRGGGYERTLFGGYFPFVIFHSIDDILSLLA